MPNFGLVTRIHVLTAIRTHDQMGAAAFRDVYGVDGSSRQVVVERGRRYDSTALLAFAYEKATGTPLASGDLPGDPAEVLRRLDFRVVSEEDVHKPAARRAPRVSRPKAAARAKPEPEVRLCPRCRMQLPASGQCDYCD